MVIRSIVSRNKDNTNEVLDFTVLVERLKRLRALNKKPDRIGLTQYTWRSFSIDKIKD